MNERGNCLVLDDVRVDYDAGRVHAVDGITLEVAAGQFLCLVGPTGCGKSSILNAVAGFIPLSAGQILFEGKQIAGPSRERGVVFQEFALFPWMTVAGNVEFGLTLGRTPPAERQDRTREILQQVGLVERADAYPYQLSGGMKQRVALARALITEPPLLLMDEPFASVDAQTRTMLQKLILNLWHDRDVTVVFVTHDVDEAVFLADRIVLLTSVPARIKQDFRVDLPRPRNQDVKYDSGFLDIKRRILECLEAEVRDAGQGKARSGR